MKPSTSASSLAPAQPASGGLYEELLASTAMAYDEQWGGSTSALDEAALLAQALAVSQQEFYERLRKSPKQAEGGNGGKS